MNQHEVTRKNVLRLSPDQQERSGLQQDIFLHGRYLVDNWLKLEAQCDDTERFYNEYSTRLTEEYDRCLQERMTTLNHRRIIMTQALHLAIDNAHTKILQTHQAEAENEV